MLARTTGGIDRVIIPTVRTDVRRYQQTGCSERVTSLRPLMDSARQVHSDHRAAHRSLSADARASSASGISSRFRTEEEAELGTQVVRRNTGRAAAVRVRQDRPGREAPARGIARPVR